MYVKLIIKNAKRSVKDYLIYIVTMTICVTLFYAFLSISSSYYRPDIGSEYDFTLPGKAMKTAICLITLCLLFLIRFVNSYMLQRRQKEFAVQSIMGMEQKTTAWLFFAETLIMGILSIISGIFLGAFFSQFITAMLLASYGKDYQLSWTLFPDTVFLTVCFFVLSFLAAGLLNIRTIRNTKIIDMLSADKRNEPDLKKSRWIFAVVVLFEIFTFLASVIGIRKIIFYYDSRFALPVKIMFWGNICFPCATLLWSAWWLAVKRKTGFYTLLPVLSVFSVLNAVVAAIVPLYTHRYYLAWGSGTIHQYLAFILIDLLFLICALMFLTANLIVTWKEKSPEHRYHGENLFFFGQLISKLNTASKTMTLICITLVLAIFLFIAAPVLVNWASGYLDIRSMYDVQIFSRYNNVYEEEDLPDDNYEIITDFLAAHQMKTAYDCTFYLYLPERADFTNRVKYDFPAAAVSLSDYNMIREMCGYGPVSLQEHEFATHWKSIASEKERDSFLTEHPRVLTDAGELTLSRHSYYEEAVGETIYNSYTNAVYIFPDSVCEKLLPVMRNRYMITAETISYEDALELEQLFTAEYPEQPDSGAAFSIRLSTLQINSSKAGSFVLQASMIYGAVVLMVICLTILSLQQLLDADQYRCRFSVLRKLGVDEQRITKLILKQLGVWFGLPILTAAVAAAVLIVYFIQTVSAQISAYIGLSTLLLQTGATVSILSMLLVCYFISTWILFRNSIYS